MTDIVEQRFSCDVHPHLISLQAAYCHGDTYCVILPWAECDLKGLWKRESGSLGDPLNKRNLTWLLGQCVGIASGLQKIHHYTTTETATHAKADASPHNNKIYGRHGDIKPENILLFLDPRNPRDLGRLVLADFGLSRFHSEITKTYFTYKDVITTITYRPPECDMEERTVSRSFDIWSLGCVLLEFVTWYLGGWDLVNEFVSGRKTLNPLYPGWLVDDFFEIVKDEKSSPGTVYVRVKCEVHNVCACYSYLGEPLRQRAGLIINQTASSFTTHFTLIRNARSPSTIS
jgi:serine/threonine protein kinase